MQIVIKISFSQLTEIIKMLQEDRLITAAQTIPEKANKYLFENMFKKLLKKQIDQYETRKQFTVSLPYPEAAVLWQTLQAVNIHDNYRLAVWNTITGNLHQKLTSQ